MTTTKIGSADWQLAREGAVALDLGEAPLVSIRGADARRFCNGMFTNNIRALQPGTFNRSAIVDDRARIGGFLSLLCLADDQFLALLDPGLDVSAFLERYERYIVFDDVAMEPRSDLRLVSVQGPLAGEALQGIGLSIPRSGHFVTEPLVMEQIRSPAGGYDLLLDAPSFERLRGAALPIWSDERIEAMRILAGRPRFPTDTGDKRLPHELSMRDELLSFDKGCYIGQETINRVDVMGEVKRALSLVRVPAGEGLQAGAKVLAEDKEIGELTSALQLPDGSLLGLAVLRKPADEPGTPLVLSQGERRFSGEALALPKPLR